MYVMYSIRYKCTQSLIATNNGHFQRQASHRYTKAIYPNTHPMAQKHLSRGSSQRATPTALYVRIIWLIFITVHRCRGSGALSLCFSRPIMFGPTTNTSSNSLTFYARKAVFTIKNSGVIAPWNAEDKQSVHSGLSKSMRAVKLCVATGDSVRFFDALYRWVHENTHWFRSSFAHFNVNRFSFLLLLLLRSSTPFLHPLCTAPFLQWMENCVCSIPIRLPPTI